MDRVVKGLNIPKAGGVTFAYLAPEMFADVKKQRLNCCEEHKKVDVYAYALVLFQIATRDMIWKGMNSSAIKDAVLAGKRPDFPTHILESTDPIIVVIQDLIKGCWEQSPADRPSFAEIIAAFAESQHNNP